MLSAGMVCQGLCRKIHNHLRKSVSFGLLSAIIAAFLIPSLPIFRFLNFAPVNPMVSGISVNL